MSLIQLSVILHAHRNGTQNSNSDRFCSDAVPSAAVLVPSGAVAVPTYAPLPPSAPSYVAGRRLAVLNDPPAIAVDRAHCLQVVPGNDTPLQRTAPVRSGW